MITVSAALNAKRNKCDRKVVLLKDAVLALDGIF